MFSSSAFTLRRGKSVGPIAADGAAGCRDDHVLFALRWRRAAPQREKKNKHCTPIVHYLHDDRDAVIACWRILMVADGGDGDASAASECLTDLVALRYQTHTYSL